MKACIQLTLVFTLAAVSLHGADDPLRAWWKVFDDPHLTSLVERSLDSNNDLKQAAARVNEARAVRGSAAASLQPSIAGAGEYRRQTAGETSIGGLKADALQTALDSVWSLDIGGGLRNSVKAADEDILAAAEARNAIRAAIAGEIGRNYIA